MRELEGCDPPCSNCRASTVDLDLPCYRASPVAQSTIAYRERIRAAVGTVTPTVFDLECRRRTPHRQTMMQAFSDVLKWHWSQERYEGPYCKTLLLKEIHRYEERVQRLRGIKPRPKDMVASSIGGLKAMSIWDDFAKLRHHMFAFIPKGTL